MPSVAIVILNWNGITDTVECLNSLQKLNYDNFKIIVVDNASTDDSIQVLENRSDIVLIKNPINKGFAGGVNTGIQYALNQHDEYIALFNNDAVPDPNWLKNLVKAAESHKEAAIVTGLLLSKDGKTIDSTTEQYSIWGMPFPQSRGKIYEQAPDSGFVFGATGGASLYKSSLFESIGFFDETFFAYYEDVDISFRAQLQGFKVYYANTAIAYHKKGATSAKLPGFTTYQAFKNIPLLFWKNVSLKLLFGVGSRLLLLYTLILGKAIVNGSGWHAIKGLVASIYYFWTSAIWKRIKIQRNKKVTPNYIWSIMYKDLPPEQTGMRKLRKIFTGKA